MVGLADTILHLNRRKQSGKLAPSEIDRTDRQITSAGLSV
jgi:hypothetical protein